MFDEVVKNWNVLFSFLYHHILLVHFLLEEIHITNTSIDQSLTK